MRFHYKSGLISLFFLAGSLLLTFFVILSGCAKNPSYPLSKFYWVDAPGSSIPSAPSTIRYTYWGVCESVRGRAKNCTNLGPAVPISPVDNFGTERGVPDWLVSNLDTMYYLSRVAWACLLVSFIFCAISFFLSLLLICSYHVQTVNSIFIFIAMVTGIAATTLYTSAIALAKQHWPGAHIGRILMGFIWATFVCNLIVLFTVFGSCARESYLRAKDKHEAHKDESLYTDHKKLLSSTGYPPISQNQGQTLSQPQQPVQYPDPYATEQTPTQQEEAVSRSRGINFFNIKRKKPEEVEV